jgi:hypothetical protein
MKIIQSTSLVYILIRLINGFESLQNEVLRNIP